MRPFFTLLALCLAWTPVGAQENRLTTKAAAEGWLLLFDGESTFGWEAKGLSDGNPKLFKADGGTLLLSGAYARLPLVQREFEFSFDYKLQAEAKPVAHVSIHAGLDLYRLPLAVHAQWTPITFACRLEKDGWKVTSSSSSPEVTSIPKAPGRIPLSFTVGATETLSLRNVKFKPLGLQSIFNGKDLAGWKVFEGKKSKFVVQDGAINIQDGPGDLQTDGKYANFVLQFECISNGKHLNSGVFFRCRPNEYQNGYEAQIRNQFTPEATQEYTIEDFDPKTRESLGKRKIKATAFDFGTGAIYRRVPARKEVAKDGEWFTLTIIASGNHLATWVNGVQTADWHDNRPLADNARNGCKLEAGHISLQGHDPTTNLSFRNFRIIELPK